MCEPIKTIAVIGAGDRGKDRYGQYILDHGDKLRVVAVAEPDPFKRQQMASAHQITPENQFEDWRPLFEKGRLADGIIIATSDDQHYEPVMAALALGYHVLLEKPMSNTLSEVLSIGRAAQDSEGAVLVCHVLRYTAFYSRIKALIDSGEIGDVVSIAHNENIGYYHFAHSFVRGNWRSSDLSSPLILSKSCHDMDLLLWLIGKKPISVSAYGSLTHFCAQKAPKGAGKRCLIDCTIRESCPYAPEKIYFPNLGKWPASVVSPEGTEEALRSALLEGPYGRCVYHCDNNVVDHMVMAMNFEEGITASFNLNAFTNEVNRTLKIVGTSGELRCNDLNREISIYRFGGKTDHEIVDLQVGGHGGGDVGIMEDFTAILYGSQAKALTRAENSVLSHVMSFAAEKSRLEGCSVSIQEMFDKA